MSKHHLTKGKKTKKTPERLVLPVVFSYTKGLFVDYLQRLLGQPIIVRPIKQELTATGLHRTTLIGTRDMPIYYAITFVKRSPTTSALIKTMLKSPTTPFGDALKKHHLFGRKTEVSVTMVSRMSTNDFFTPDDNQQRHPETWERLYTILSPQGEAIASVLEIAPPGDEEISQAALSAKQRRATHHAKRRTKRKSHTRKRKGLRA